MHMRSCTYIYIYMHALPAASAVHVYTYMLTTVLSVGLQEMHRSTVNANALGNGPGPNCQTVLGFTFLVFELEVTKAQH